MGKDSHVEEDNSPISPDSEAAKLLEAALLQMDGIIADAGSTPPRPDYTTASAILRWIGHQNVNALLSDADERVQRLESDKESLQMQVSVLSEQIAAQSDKISDLERMFTEKKNMLEEAESRLQKEMVHRSTLESQRVELLTRVNDYRMRLASLEQSVAGSSAPSVSSPVPVAPRTPPSTYGRQVERNVHVYSSLPRHSPDSPARVVAFGKPHALRHHGHSVPNLADKEEIIPAATQGSPSASPSARWGGRLLRGSSGGALEGADEAAGSFTRGGVRATAAARLQRDSVEAKWSTVLPKDWDLDVTCQWLESLGLEQYVPAAKTWITSAGGERGIVATATVQQIEKELALRNPMHRKKILLSIMDLQDTSSDPLLRPAGRLDTSWTLRWLEDAGLPQAREAWAEARVDGRVLHRLTHDDLAHHLRLASQLHALSVRRGIQVLRDNNFSPDTMIRRGGTSGLKSEPASPSAEGKEVNDSTLSESVGPDGSLLEGTEVEPELLARWSSHRVMEWLKAIDLAEYAPNLRGAGVHGGLMLHEPRFTAELLATLLNIPTSKTLLRRHLTQRFNELLGREVIQEKRTAEQTLGYQPLTITSKYKVPKKGQFSLKRRKNKGDPDYGDLVCPLTENSSDDESATGSRFRSVSCLSPA